jgi:hypothetical protein
MMYYIIWKCNLPAFMTQALIPTNWNWESCMRGKQWELGTWEPFQHVLESNGKIKKTYVETTARTVLCVHTTFWPAVRQTRKCNEGGRSVKLLLVLASIVILDFRPRLDLWPCFYSSHYFYMLWNVASSSTRGVVWLLLVTPPLLGSDCWLSLSLTHSLTDPLLHAHSRWGLSEEWLCWLKWSQICCK